MTSIGLRGEAGPPFLSGDHRIAVWAPGKEIRFEKPLSAAFFVRLPMALVILAGPATWFALSRQGAGLRTIVGQAVFCAVLGAIGLWIGWSNLDAAFRALPRRVTFDWTSGRLGVAAFGRGEEVPLDALTAIEVKGIQVDTYRRQDGHDVPITTHYYKGRLVAHHRAAGTSPAGEIDLVETELREEDPVAALREATTVAAELAAALGVPHQLTDYPDR